MHATPLDPRALRPHYARFLGDAHASPTRLLLTGHSHQAWPDVAREGVIEAFDDAAAHVDDKWGRAFERVERVRRAVGERVGCDPGEVALAPNTHELFTRLLSALPLRARPVVVATDGEFHSVYRQLAALAGAGLVEVDWVPAAPCRTLGERLAARVLAHGARCALAVTSTVTFLDAAVTQGLDALSAACARVGARLFLDAYHSFCVVPLDLRALPHPEGVYLSGGGYKYAQWGEGVCWLRVPPSDDARPLYTGWFSDYEHLHEARVPHAPTRYGARPAERFAGSTFDPTSAYRAARVCDFFEERGMTDEALRALSLRQTALLIEALDPHLRVLTPLAPELRGGFVAVEVPRAHRAVERLRARGVFVDARGDSLRLGPAPYLLDEELTLAAAAAVEVAREGAREE